MSLAQQITPAPFDALAQHYDDTFTHSRIGRAQRAAVWAELGTAFRAGNRVLEIGCGTGVDACFLGERGIRVVACDSSSQMIQVTTRRVRAQGLDGLAVPKLLRAECISALRSEELFDGAFSNFGALNCVQDVRQLAHDLACILKPGATALLCWMGPCCLWEIAWYLLHGNRKAFRRFHSGPVTARLSGGASVSVNYPTVRALARIFSPEFKLRSMKGIGIAVPPSYLEHWAQKHPG